MAFALLIVTRRPSAAANAPATDAIVAVTGDVGQKELHWEQVADLEFPAFVDALRNRGWSPQLVRAALRARLNLLYSPRRLEVRRSRPLHYWTGTAGGFFMGNPDGPTRVGLRKLYKEQEELTRTLLGEEADSPMAREWRLDRYGPMPAEKLAALQEIESDYSDLIQQVREESRGIILPEDQEMIQMLEAERDRDTAELLTPEEYEGYELRASQTAFALRLRLSSFVPSEQEYRAIFELQKDFEERFGGRYATPEQQRRRWEAQAELDQEIAAVLSPERFEDYQLTTHPSWSQTASWVEQRNLPPAATRGLTAVAVDIQKRRQEVQQDRTLSQEERNARLAALHRDATMRIGQILPPTLIPAYEAGPGAWLRTLKPPTP